VYGLDRNRITLYSTWLSHNSCVYNGKGTGKKEMKNWYFTKTNRIVDLNRFSEFSIHKHCALASKKNEWEITVVGHEGESEKILGYFKTDEEAKEYLELIYKYLIMFEDLIAGRLDEQEEDSEPDTPLIKAYKDIRKQRLTFPL